MRAPFWLARIICWWKVHRRLRALRPKYTLAIAPNIQQIAREPLSGSSSTVRLVKFDTHRILTIEIWSEANAPAAVFRTRLIWSDFLGAWSNDLQPDKVDTQIISATERVLIAMERAFAAAADSDLPQQPV